jgi:indolepyruvate ferredoxin oxidoreductase alpha subunit
VPVSHLIDVLGDARELLDTLGIYFENSASEAGAAAMLGASINYPVRGAVTWKSTVGTNVASDALSNLASAGVQGGALVILDEDYGEGSSIIQERTHAFAMKSQMWLMDPRPNLTSIVEAVEKSFELSEASHTPVMLQLHIRACHVHGSFVCKDNRAPEISTRETINQPKFDFSNINLPPSIYAHERLKIESRWPAAVNFIKDHQLNERFGGDCTDVGLVIPGGLYNGTIRALQQLGLADTFGNSRIPLQVLNVVYPLVPDEQRIPKSPRQGRLYLTSSLLGNWDKKGADDDQFLRAYDWDGKDLKPVFDLDFYKLKLGRAHHMKFSARANQTAAATPEKSSFNLASLLSR